MHRAFRRLVVALALAAALVIPAGASAGEVPLGGINLPGMGLDSVPSEADHLIAQAKALHVKVVRTDFAWSVLEPEGPELNPRALEYTDRLLSDAASAGIKVIATVASTPCWASSSPAALANGCGHGRNDGDAGSWPPTDDADYASLLATLAQRYGNELAAIEVWNEPDQVNEAYFAGPEKAAKYAALLKAAYPAVKAVDPSLTVLAGSLVGSNGNFLKALYEHGIKGYYDGISVHFYTLTLGAIRSIRETQLANGDTKPLWLDEFGWTSCWPAKATEQEQACVTPATQALNLRNTIRELARARYVAATIVYKLQDSTEETFGAISRTGAHKPSYRALTEAFEHPLGAVSPVTLSLRRKGGRVLASGSAPVGDFMELEASYEKLRYRALFTLNRFNDYSITLPAAVSKHGVRVAVYQYWEGRKRATRKKL